MSQFVEYKLFIRIMTFSLIFLIGGCASAPDSKELTVEEAIPESEQSISQTNTKESKKNVVLLGRMSRILLDVNGKTHKIEADVETPLIFVLRNNLGLMGAKFGCGLEPVSYTHLTLPTNREV